MQDVTLATILQISDLHLGTFGPAYDAKIFALLQAFPCAGGWLGHGDQSCSDLERFVAALRRDRPDVMLVVSGDLTATGAVDQFHLAADFLGTAGLSSTGFGFGLNVPDWRDRSVSGNHDQWPGTLNPMGGPTPGLAMCLPAGYPVIGPPIPLPGGRKLRFILVDSDADVGSVSLERLLARGDFASQLGTLHSALPAVDAGEIRVMVIHHAITTKAAPAPAAAEPFPRGFPAYVPNCNDILEGSLRALEPFLVDHGIRIVMSGHIHKPRLSLFTAQAGGRTAPVFETRCGTTTHRDEIPTRIKAKLVRAPKLHPNTLLLHEILSRNGRTVWRTEVYTRMSGRGFVSPRGLPPAHAAHLTREIQL